MTIVIVVLHNSIQHTGNHEHETIKLVLYATGLQYKSEFTLRCIESMIDKGKASE